MVYHMPNCIVLFSKSSFFIQKAQSTIANSLPPDPLHTASTSLSFSSKHPNPPQTTNYISPSSADAPDIKTPVFRKTSGIPAPASARCGFLWCTLRTVDSTARYWSDKRMHTVFSFRELPGTGIAAALPFIPLDLEFCFQIFTVKCRVDAVFLK